MSALHPLTAIEAGLMSGEAPADLLRKVMLLGGIANAPELRAWARRELDGYADTDDEVPSYRVISALIAVDYMAGPMHGQGQTISAYEVSSVTGIHITNDLPLKMPIAELGRMSESTQGSVKLVPAWAPLFLSKCDDGQPFQNTYSIYYTLSPGTIAGAVDRVLTQLAEFVAELRSKTPEGSDIPSRDAVSTAFSVVINGGSPVLSWGDQATITGSINVQPGDRGQLRQALAGVGVNDDEWDELIGAMRVDAGQGDAESFGSATRGWLSKVGKRVDKVATDVTSGTAGGVLSAALAGYFGLTPG